MDEPAPLQATELVAATHWKRRYLSIIGVQGADAGMAKPARTHSSTI